MNNKNFVCKFVRKVNILLVVLVIVVGRFGGADILDLVSLYGQQRLGRRRRQRSYCSLPVNHFSTLSITCLPVNQRDRRQHNRARHRRASTLYQGHVDPRAADHRNRINMLFHTFQKSPHCLHIDVFV